MPFSTKLLSSIILAIILCVLLMCCFAAEDVYVSGGENRSVPTELEPGITYNAQGDACGFPSSPGERNAGWYVVNTIGYKWMILHCPIVTNPDNYWIEIFDENGKYIDSSQIAQLNDEFHYSIDVSGNDRIYLQVIFGDIWAHKNAGYAIFTICLEKDGDVKWEERSTHIWEDLRSDKTIINEPTCTSIGMKAHKKCALCGEYGYYERIEPIPHTEGEWIVESEPDCENPGKQVTYCTMCGDIVEERSIPATGHSFTEWSVITEATYRSPGLRERFCEICGKVENEEYTLDPPEGLLEFYDYELTVMPDDTVKMIGYYGIDTVIDLPEAFEIGRAHV